MSRNPKITHRRKKVYVDGKKFDRQKDDLDDNLVTVGPFPAFFYAADTYILFLLKDSDDLDEFASIITDEHPDPKMTFPFFQERMGLDMVGTIPKFWKMKAAKKFLVAAVQYWVPPGKDVVVATHMAVKSPYRRNKINAFMFDYIEKRWPDKDILFHDPTKMGQSFMDFYGGKKYE